MDTKSEGDNMVSVLWMNHRFFRPDAQPAQSTETGVGPGLFAAKSKVPGMKPGAGWVLIINDRGRYEAIDKEQKYGDCAECFAKETWNSVLSKRQTPELWQCCCNVFSQRDPTALCSTVSQPFL